MTATVEGGLDIRLTVAGGRVSQVDIINHRLLTVPRSLAGLSAEAAAATVARLYSLCKVAQGLTAAAAVEQAAGHELSTPQRLARRFLLLGETVLEHGGRVALDWPLLLGEPPLAAVVKRLRRSLADLPNLLAADGSWMRPGGADLIPDPPALAARLAEAESALIEADALIPMHPDALSAWIAAGRGPAARLLGRLIERGGAGLGDGGVPTLPDFAAERLSVRLDEDTYTARPDWEGAVCETGPWARLRGHPLVVAVAARHGAGLLVRFVARLVELAQALREMRELCPSLCQDRGRSLDRVSGRGLAVTEATRGRLVHRCDLRDGMVADWRILAPTEWNFHPQGPLARGLAGLPAEGVERRAALMVAALDPCVGYRVSLAEAG